MGLQTHRLRVMGQPVPGRGQRWEVGEEELCKGPEAKEFYMWGTKGISVCMVSGVRIRGVIQRSWGGRVLKTGQGSLETTGEPGSRGARNWVGVRFGKSRR